MPIIIKDFTWTQTDNTVHIRIPIKAVRHEKVDLFTADSYLKIHFSPFLFEAFLQHQVDNAKSKCIETDDLLTLDLFKRENIEWTALEKELTKPEKMKLRQEIIDKNVEQSQQAKEDRRIKKSQLDRFTVQQAMDIDAKQHSLMDQRKAQETSNAMNALEDWRVNLSGDQGKVIIPNHNISEVEFEELEDEPRITEIEDDELEAEEKSDIVQMEEKVNGDKEETKISEQDNDLTDKEITTKKLPMTEKEMYKAMLATKPDKKPKEKVINIPIRSQYVDKKREEVKNRVLPRLRDAGQVEITHTQRTFPTPSRESHAAEEEAWLKNVTLARRATGFVSEDLRPEEQDPQWCKEKGDQFFKTGNFLGAISAYTHGISLSDKLPSLYANRSATHFALGNFSKCMDDCSTALDLMKPACEGNRRSRAKCIARRGAALARCGYLHKGIEEMKAAQKLLPDDDNIKKDIYDMERAWEQNPDDN